MCAAHLFLKSNILIGQRSSKDYYKRPGGGVGIWEGSLGCAFLRGSMCAEGMVIGRGGIDGYFEEQRLPVGIQECLERLRCLSQTAVCSNMGQPEW